MSDKNRVYIFDTTMRDGEQSPGASMSLEEKIQIARVFDDLGIDIDIREHNRAEIESHPMFGRIDMIEGSSID